MVVTSWPPKLHSSSGSQVPRVSKCTVVMGISITEIIRKKRDGYELSTEEIRFFLNAVVNNEIDECQTGAMLMAMFLKNLNFRETVDMTSFMAYSGETLNLKNFPKKVLVDKHSTGGVGDKVSLSLAPALAALGLKVPMISGRTLGYTGGTLDKLESIPGFQVDLSPDRMNACLEKAGCFICGASTSFVPADAILYRTRDLTATVENSALVVASILSKKAAEGIGTLVLDVKFGKGSMFKTKKDAEEMGKVLVKVGNMLHMNTQAVLTEMNAPLGNFVGNSLEVVEAIMCLRNEVDNPFSDLVKLLGGVILKANGMAESIEDGKIMIGKTFENKTALTHFEKMLVLQGVSEENATELCRGDFWKVLPKAKTVTRLKSPKTGVVVDIDALKIGQACWSLGGGRGKSGAKIDHSCGVVLLKRVGDPLVGNEPWIEIHFSEKVLPSGVEYLISSSLKVEAAISGFTPTFKNVIMADAGSGN